jgi:curved DNA-binding protein CbpA
MEYFGDNRVFRRYKHSSEFLIIIEANSYKASTVDFSLKGLCVFIEGAPPLTLYSIVDLRIGELEMDLKGTVVWLKETGSNLLVGIEKMSISGLLKYYPLYDILMDLQRSDSTGILEIHRDPTYKEIYYEKGVMLSALSNLKEDRIEDIILKTGKITIEQYHHAAGIVANDKKSQGKVFVDLGYLRPQEFIQAIKRQAEEIVLGLFVWEDGVVMFRETPPPANIFRLKLSASNLIFQGIKRIIDPEYFRRISPPPDTVLYYSNEPLNLFQDIVLSEKDKYVLSLLDGHLAVKQVLSISSLGSFRTLNILCALFATRMIDTKEKGVLDDRSLADIISEPQSYVDEAFISKVDDMYAFVNRKSTDYYNILGIDRDATQAAIKKAYYKNAKEFHPDKHINITSESMKEKVSLIFSRNTNAYKILSDPREKEKYDKSLKLPKPETKKSNTEIAKQSFMEGRKAFNEGLFPEAFDLFSQAVYFDSTAADYHFYLGLTLKSRNRLSDAEKEINKAININPGEASYLAEVGHIYLALGFILRAKSAFEKALKLDFSISGAIKGLEKVRQLEENQ